MVEHKVKISNSVLGIAAIIAIFLIVYVTVGFTPKLTILSASYNSNPTSDQSGYAAEAIAEDYGEYADTSSTLSCNILLGLNADYDYNAMSVTLESESSITYAGNTISVGFVNDDGCMVIVGETSEYLALGQIQRVGPVYVTVRDIVIG
jgi:hypothetical protein